MEAESEDYFYYFLFLLFLLLECRIRSKITEYLFKQYSTIVVLLQIIMQSIIYESTHFHKNNHSSYSNGHKSRIKLSQ